MTQGFGEGCNSGGHWYTVPIESVREEIRTKRAL